MAGMNELALINAHWHRAMAKVLGSADRNAAIKWIRDMIEKYKVRFVMGDFNMSAFQIVYDLRACGIEATVISQHTELNEKCDGYVHDSCAIIAIGGCMYPPKPSTLESHCCMAAQLGNGSNGEFGVRGFDISSYIFADKANRPDDHIDDNLVKRVKVLRRIAAHRSTCTECTKEQRCTVHHYQKFNDRVSPPRQAGVKRGDQRFAVTKDLPVFQDIKGFQSNPMMWDQMEKQLKGVAHWPLYVTVGSTRGRSDAKHRERASAYHTRQISKPSSYWWTARSAPAAAPWSSKASSSQSAPAAQNGRSNFAPAPRQRSRTTLELRREADRKPRSRVNLTPRGVTSVSEPDRRTDGPRRRWTSAEKRSAREERERGRAARPSSRR